MWVDRHDEKLRRGQLAGNRFAIRVRGVDASAAPRALKALRELERRGAPNRFGPQRFGARGNNHEVGRRLLAGDAAGAVEHALLPYEGGPDLADHEARRRCAEGDWAGAVKSFPRASRAERRLAEALAEGATPEEALDWVDETQRRFWLSAAQSAIFNRVLDQRVRDQTFDRVLEGDLALRHSPDRSSREPVAIDAEELADPTLSERIARFDLSPSGPMWGPGMTEAQGAVGELERAALAEMDLAPEDLDRFDALHGSDLIRGARRELRVPVTEATVEGGVDEHGPYVLCAFALPSGAFATVVMDEIMSPAGGTPETASKRKARA
jgi:tRNA pseudouridine13 synthase